ncbi:MAG: PEGA domain-containing protein [Polyangiaceae bacterium]|nr:PEGA domain-containing protein [Polyangiaceae bacterium]
MSKLWLVRRDSMGCSLVAASVIAVMAVTSLVSPEGALAQPQGAVGAGSASAAPAGPISDGNRKEAAERFKRGVQLQADGNLDAAVLEFERAYELAPAYQVLFNIAVVYRDKNDRASALRAFERFLAEGGAKIDAKRRKEVEGEIAKLRDVVATLIIKSSVDGADVILDDIPLGKTPIKQPILVNVGRHKIEASKEGYKNDSQLFAVAGRDERTITLNLKEIKVEPPPPPTTAPPPPPPPPPNAPPAPPPGCTHTRGQKGRRDRQGHARALGGGLGSFFGLSARSAWKDAKDLGCGEGTCPTRDAQDKSESAKNNANLSTLGFGLGSTTLVAGVVLLLTAPSSKDSAKLQLTPSMGKHEGSLHLMSRF